MSPLNKVWHLAPTQNWQILRVSVYLWWEQSYKLATNSHIPSRRRKSGLENYCWWAFNTLLFWAAINHRFTQHRFSWLKLWDLPLMILCFLINNFTLNSIVSRTHQLIKVITGGSKWWDNSKPFNMSRNVFIWCLWYNKEFLTAPQTPWIIYDQLN